MPDPTFFATSTTRAACLGFTKALALQLAPEYILVNSVNIGFVVTPQWENIWQTHAPHLEREAFFRQMAQQDVPLGRFGTVEEVAGIVAFLCSRRASYICVLAWRRLDCQVEVGDRVMTASWLVGVAWFGVVVCTGAAIGARVCDREVEGGDAGWETSILVCAWPLSRWRQCFSIVRRPLRRRAASYAKLEQVGQR
jgi:hypothetical protein